LRFVSGEIGEAGSRGALFVAKGNTPTVRIGQWNFRTMMFNEPAMRLDSGVPRVRIRRDNFGVALELSGVTGATRSRVKLDDATYNIDLVEESGKLVGSIEPAAAKQPEPLNQAPRVVSTDDAQAKAQETYLDLRAFEMQWIEDRSDALYTVEHDGDRALVMFETQSTEIEHVSGRIGADGKTNHISMYRIAVPSRHD